MAESLLPPNATALERATTKTCAAMAALSVPLRSLWDPQQCPVPLLPYLAWSLSVNYWESTWPEATKRAVIQASCLMHQRKGTIWALRQALEPLGYTITLTEWWQPTPPDAAGTFRLSLKAKHGISDTSRRELERLIDEVKPVSRHLISLDLAFDAAGVIRAGLATLQGDILTVYAYMPESVSSAGAFTSSSAVHLINILQCAYFSEPLAPRLMLSGRAAIHTIGLLRCLP